MSKRIKSQNTAPRLAGVALPIAAIGLMPFLMSSSALAGCSGTQFIDCVGAFASGVDPQVAYGIDQQLQTRLTIRNLTQNVGILGGSTGATLTSTPLVDGANAANLEFDYQDQRYGIVSTNSNVAGIFVASNGAQGQTGATGGTGGNGSTFNVGSNGDPGSNGGTGQAGNVTTAPTAGGIGDTGSNGDQGKIGVIGLNGGNGGIVTVRDAAPFINLSGSPSGVGLIATSVGGQGGTGGMGGTGGVGGAGATGGIGGAGGTGGYGGDFPVFGGTGGAGGNGAVGGQGGQGGIGGTGGDGNTGGNGGTGGPVIVNTVNPSGTIGFISVTGLNNNAITAISAGGMGGTGGQGGTGGVGGAGGTGGVGGAGGNGGNGGYGSLAGGDGGDGGNGGKGGAGGVGGAGGIGGVGGAGGNGGSSSTVDVTNVQNLITTGNGGAGILAASLGGAGGNPGAGGVGGAGGAAGTGGAGGAAGFGGFGGEGGSVFGADGNDGTKGGQGSIGTKGKAGATGQAGSVYGVGASSGMVFVTNSGTIDTSGNHADGITAVSIAGVAGMPNAAGDGGFYAMGNDDQSAGQSGSVDVKNTGAITLTGNGSNAIVALSIGNGGGYRGENLTRVGGVSSLNGSAGAVSIDNSGTINSPNGGGLIALSIGGGGGIGGGAGDLAVGGVGTNGDGGNVAVTNNANITTGKNSITAQSIGGGGGIGFGGGDLQVGGVASSGNAGQVDVTSTGNITSTGGAGIIAQAIGGGGGIGFGDGVLDVGGVAATGNGGQVGVTSTGNINANGPAIAAQSIGGGGGIGSSSGDPQVGGVTVTGNGAAVSVSSTGNVTSSNAAVLIGQSIGGGGGIGSGQDSLNVGGVVSSGNGGTVDVKSSGNVTATTGTAIVAQSVGGGGGLGLTSGADVSVGGTVSTGNGAAVTVTSAGTVSAVNGYGIVAQSIGGGGGMGIGVGGNGNLGGTVATGNGGTVEINQTGGMTTDRTALLGQSIGGGGGIVGGTTGDLTLGGTVVSGNGGAVTVNAKGGTALYPVTVQTNGHNAPAIIAQSVGGGGGIGGGSKDVHLGGIFVNQDQVNGGDTVAFVDSFVNVVTQGNSSIGILSQSVGGGGGLVGRPSNGNVFFGAVLGGEGLASANGGAASVNVNGNVTTYGDGAHGIVAQSVGGGGGLQTIGSGAPGSFTYSGIGGAGNGGPVNVISTRTVSTSGVGAIGIVAQSVAGGGGMGGTNGANGLLRGFGTGTGFAGSAGGAGNAGTVDVASNYVVTDNNFATGIFAQSVANTGSSGNVTVNAYDTRTDGTGAGGIVAESRRGDGANNAGNVTVTSNYVRTQGTYSTGISALSIMGDGSGTSGAVGVTVGYGVRTDSDYSPGIVAQSIHGVRGDSGNVTVTLDTGSDGVRTYGTDSTGILAQSITGTSGNAGTVTVGVAQGSNVRTLANGTIAIDTESTGGNANGKITVNNAGNVVGGYQGIAIRMTNGVNNEINNASTGFISTYYSPRSEIATSNTIVGGSANDTVNNDGGNAYCGVHCDPVNGPGIYGNVSLGGGINAFNNNDATAAGNTYYGAYFAPGDTVDLGAGNAANLLTNKGMISPGDFYNRQTTYVTGNFTQTSSGRYLTDLFLDTNSTDQIIIQGTQGLTGTAALDGKVRLSFNNPGWAAPGTYDRMILRANYGFTSSVPGTGFDSLESPPSAVFTPDLHTFTSGDTQEVHLGYTINFAPSGLTGNQRGVGNAVNGIQTAGVAAFRPIAAQLFFVPNVPELGAIYDNLSGEGVTGVQQSVFSSRNQFFDVVMDQSSSMTMRNQWRVWAQGFGNGGHQNGEGGVGSAKSSQTNVGGALGVDVLVNPNVLLGAAVGGGRSTFSVSNRSTSGDSDGVNLGIYGKAMLGGGLYAQGLISYGHYANTTTRYGVGRGLQATDPWNYCTTGIPGQCLTPIGIYNARGSFDSNLIGGRFEMGWTTSVGQANLTPFANIQIDHQSLDGFSEQGQLGLRFGSRSVTSVPMQLGAQLDGNFDLSNGMTLTPKVRVSWVHEFESSRNANASFLIAPGFGWNVKGASAVQDAARVEAGATLNIAPNWTVRGNVIGVFSDRGSSVGGTGGVSYSW